MPKLTAERKKLLVTCPELNPDAGVRWGRIRDLPVSKSLAERLIREGIIESHQLKAPGSKRGPRLINLDSFDRWVRGETPQEAKTP